MKGSPARSTSILWNDLLVLDREGGMKWRVMVELAGAEGTVVLQEVSAGGSTGPAPVWWRVEGLGSGYRA